MNRWLYQGRTVTVTTEPYTHLCGVQLLMVQGDAVIYKHVGLHSSYPGTRVPMDHRLNAAAREKPW